jgi:hypothetical protein
MKAPGNAPKMERIHPLTAFVRRLDGEFYTGNELAETLSVAPEYLLQIRRTHPELAPSVIVNYHGRPLRLYDREDANRLARYFAGHEQVGQERRHSMAAVAARAKLWGRIRSYRRRAENARDEGQRARLLAIAEKLTAERAAL